MKAVVQSRIQLQCRLSAAAPLGVITGMLSGTVNGLGISFLTCKVGLMVILCGLI